MARPAVAPAAGGTPRMSDVARLAGVSLMTVSRALNTPGKVSEEVRGRVGAAMSTLGYVHNRLAGRLSSNRSNVVALVVPNLANALFSQTIQGAADVLGGRDFQLLIGDCGYGLEAEEALVASFVGQCVAGLILHNTTHTAATVTMLERAGLPVVETGTLTPAPVDMVVSYANRDAAAAMTRHLLRLGYRRIGLVTLSAANNDRSRDRQEGYRAALRAAGIAPDPRLMLEMPAGIDAGAAAVVRLMEGGGAPDAVFFAGDVLAIGALMECQRRGWSVPGRLGIAAFDDIDLMRHTVPSITTLNLPRFQIGHRSAELLLDRIEGRSAERPIVDLGFEIIQREST